MHGKWKGHQIRSRKLIEMPSSIQARSGKIWTEVPAGRWPEARLRDAAETRFKDWGVGVREGLKLTHNQLR